MKPKYTEAQKAAQKKYRETHRDKVNRRNLEWYHRNRETQLPKRRAYTDAHRAHIYKQNTEWQRTNRQLLFSKIVQAYGGKCACCGEDEIKFLELDHIYNDGNKERKQRGVNSHTLYQWIVNNGFPEDRYQILCSNCNRGKYRNGGICPHKTKNGQ